MKLQLVASVALFLLGAAPGAYSSEPKVDGLAIISEDFALYSSSEDVLGDLEDVRSFSSSEDDDFEDASSKDVLPVFTSVGEESGRVSCRGLGSRDCRDRPACEYDWDQRTCVQSSGSGSGRECRSFNRRQCQREKRTCSWTGRECVRRSSSPSGPPGGSSCRGLGSRDCRDRSDCEWDWDLLTCLRSSASPGRECRDFDRRRCQREKRTCRWTGRDCIRRSESPSSPDVSPSSPDVGCGRFRRSECQLRSSCRWDMRIDACLRDLKTKDFCSGLKVRQCGRVQGCRWIKRGGRKGCVRIIRGGQNDDRVDDDVSNDDLYKDYTEEA